MRYFIDTEFKEAFHKPLFGKRRHYIDLISIGIVAEDGRTYYAVSNEFDLKEIWNDDWLRKNVLKPIHDDLCHKQTLFSKSYFPQLFEPFTLKSMKALIKWHGKSNKRIAMEIEAFVYKPFLDENPVIFSDNWHPKDVQFYGYFADYDWVLLCSLFGRMLDLPKGFPYFCIDLKQMLDQALMAQVNRKEIDRFGYNGALKARLKMAKQLASFPKQENEHDALSDAKWNFDLYRFIQSIKSQPSQINSKFLL